MRGGVEGFAGVEGENVVGPSPLELPLRHDAHREGGTPCTDEPHCTGCFFNHTLGKQLSAANRHTLTSNITQSGEAKGREEKISQNCIVASTKNSHLSSGLFTLKSLMRYLSLVRNTLGENVADCLTEKIRKHSGLHIQTANKPTMWLHSCLVRGGGWPTGLHWIPEIRMLAPLRSTQNAPVAPFFGFFQPHESSWAPWAYSHTVSLKPSRFPWSRTSRWGTQRPLARAPDTYSR